MPPLWTADDYQRIMVSTTVCLCLLIFVLGTFWLLRLRVVDATTLGVVSGSGVLGIGTILVKILGIAIKKV
jgi:hypothetical protein